MCSNSLLFIEKLGIRSSNLYLINYEFLISFICYWYDVLSIGTYYNLVTCIMYSVVFINLTK